MDSWYIDICENIWGCVPLDKEWAKGTELYKQELERMKKVERLTIHNDLLKMASKLRNPFYEHVLNERKLGDKTT